MCSQRGLGTGGSQQSSQGWKGWQTAFESGSDREHPACHAMGGACSSECAFCTPASRAPPPRTCSKPLTCPAALHLVGQIHTALRETENGRRRPARWKTEPLTPAIHLACAPCEELSPSPAPGVRSARSWGGRLGPVLLVFIGGGSPF